MTDQQTQRYRPLAEWEKTESGDKILIDVGDYRDVRNPGWTVPVGNNGEVVRPIPETNWRDPVGEAGYPYPPGTVVEFKSSCSGGSISQWLIGHNGYWERLDAKTSWRGPCGQQCKHRVIDYRPDLVAQETPADETQTPLSRTGETQDLLPCPFCGGDSRIDSWTMYHRCVCEKCGAMGSGSHIRDTAIEKWNTRSESAELTSLRAEVDRLNRSVLNWERLSFTVASTADAARDEIERLNAELAKYKPSEIKAIDLTETTVFVGAAWGREAGEIQ